MNIGPLNVTLNQSSSVPMSQLRTGQSSTDLIRSYARHKGSPYIKVWEDFYDGNKVIQHYRKPYSKEIHVKGTDGFQFGAGLTEKDTLYYFDDFALRTLAFNFASKGRRGDVDTLKFKVDVASVSQPQHYPDSLGCPMANISAVHKTPLVFALPGYYECGSVEMLRGVTIDGKSVGTGDVDLEFEVEPYTGMTLNINYKYEVSTVGKV